MIKTFDVLISNQYIYTPLTWIHYIATGYKIYTIMFLLIIIPYQKYSYIVTIIIICSIAFISMLLPKTYYFYIPKMLIYILVYLIFNQLHDINNHLIRKDLLKINFNLIKQNYYILLPKYIIRIICITLLNLISLKILLYTTMYENIALFLFQLIHKKDCILKEILLITALSYQFLDQMPIYLNRYWISIKVRNQASFTIRHFTNHYFIYYLIVFMKHQIYRISSIFHIRKVYLNDFKIYDFDYMNINIIYNKNL